MGHGDVDVYETGTVILEKWAEVHELECAMKDVREKYARIFIDVLDRVSAKHKELNRRVWNCNKIPEDESPEELGYINVGSAERSGLP